MTIKQSFLKIALSLFLVMSLFSFNPNILANQSRIPYAGQHTEVGVVDISINGYTPRIDYTITKLGWCLNITHLTYTLYSSDMNALVDKLENLALMLNQQQDEYRVDSNLSNLDLGHTTKENILLDDQVFFS